jgi:hypothetical protein
MGICSSTYKSDEKIVIIGGGLVGAAMAKIAQESFHVTLVSYLVPLRLCKRTK